MSRKRRNLLSKKRKNSKRNTKRNTKTRKNMRIMRGGATNKIWCANINIGIGTTFKVTNAAGVNNIIVNRYYEVISIKDDADRENDPMFDLELKIFEHNVGVAGAVENFVRIPFSALNTCTLEEAIIV